MRKLLYATTVTGTLKHFLAPFAEHFRRAGWQVDAAAGNASNCRSCTETFNRVWDIGWTRNPLAPGNLQRAAAEIRTLVDREGYDLVHVHTPVASFITRFALRRRPRRPVVIYTAHGFHFYRGGRWLSNRIFLHLEKIAGHWTDYLVTINREDFAAAGRHGIVARDRLKYMPGIGVDRQAFAPAATSAAAVVSLRAGLGVTGSDRLLLAVGELNRNKRPDLLLDAFAALPHTQVHLAFVGPGYLEPQLRRQAARRKVAHRTHFLGARSDVPALLAAGDALVQASRREGLPRSIMEALCMARPCVGSDVRGTRDLLGDGCGVLFRTDDGRDLTRAISWVIEHPVEAQTMAQRGCQKMREFDIRHILQLHEELYAEALASH